MTISTTLPLPFEHVTTWVFDLDNTLYPSHVRLFDQIEVRMRDYVARTVRVDLAEADRLRAHYWRTHGTTIAGLMREHAIDPDTFLDLSLIHISEPTRPY